MVTFVIVRYRWRINSRCVSPLGIHATAVLVHDITTRLRDDGQIRLREMTLNTGSSSTRVAALWRYPVKSMQGETCDELRFEESGVAGDRSFGVLDLGSRTILSAKREGRLLEATASLVNGELSVRLPGGHDIDPGDALDESMTRWLGRPVTLVDVRTHGIATFESPEDFERDDSNLERWEGMAGSFVDESPLHFLTTADLELLSLERPDLQWDVRRFRPNIVIAADAGSLDPLEHGQRLTLGEVEIEILKGCTRCVMTTRPQPGNLDRQLDILRHTHALHDSQVGQRARVVVAGTVRVGDRVCRAA